MISLTTSTTSKMTRQYIFVAIEIEILSYVTTKSVRVLLSYIDNENDWTQNNKECVILLNIIGLFLSPWIMDFPAQDVRIELLLLNILLCIQYPIFRDNTPLLLE